MIYLRYKPEISSQLSQVSICPAEPELHILYCRKKSLGIPSCTSAVQLLFYSKWVIPPASYNALLNSP